MFGNHGVRTESDGYVVAFRTNNPVEVRREANQIMLAMVEHEADEPGAHG